MGDGYHIRCKNCREEMNTKLLDCDNYSSYQIIMGCGLYCLSKEQLLTKYDIILENDSCGKEKIKNKLNDDYEFSDPIGYLPYYCKNCQILDNKFYFEMNKKGKKYIPEYKCKICDRLLESIIIDDGEWGKIIMDYKESDASNLISIYDEKIIFDGEYYNTEYSTFEIMDKRNKVYKLKCRKCNKFDYEIIRSSYWD